MNKILCTTCRHDHEDGCEVPDSSVAYRCAISDPRNEVFWTALNHRTGSIDPVCLGYLPTLAAPPHLASCYPPEELPCDIVGCQDKAVIVSKNGFPYCHGHKGKVILPDCPQCNNSHKVKPNPKPPWFYCTYHRYGFKA